MDGFWVGRAAPADVDWCEPNYVVTPYVAELWNTLSSLPMVVLGAWGLIAWMRRGDLPRRYAWLFVGLAIVGVGSAAFHGTLLRPAQALDELPMIYLGLVGAWALALRERPREAGRELGVVLVAYCVLFTAAYTTAQGSFLIFIASYALIVTYVALRSIQLTWLRPSSPLLSGLLATAFFGFVGTLGLCWIPEHVLLPCDHPLQVLPLHAIWHLGAGLGTYAWCLWVIVDRWRVHGRGARLVGGFVEEA